MPPKINLRISPKLKKNLIVIAIYMILSICFKVIPHAPNFSPQIVFFLVMARTLSKRILLPSIILITIASDGLGAAIYGYNAFGSWTLFTYSAYLLIGLLGTLGQNSKKSISWFFLSMAMFSSLLFWVWTNFGVWLCSSIYTRSLTGFFECYIMAIPFLINSLEGTIVWVVVLVALDKIYKKINCFCSNHIQVN